MGTPEALLAFYITFPPLALAAVVTTLLKRNKRRKDSWKKILCSLSPEHGLASHTIFWLVVLTPLIYFVIFGFYAWQGYEPKLNPDGFKTFLEISTLPIAILSLSIPLTALVTYLHSTGQTAKQIEKNEHELFYLHRREFVYYFEQIGATEVGSLNISYKIPPRTHEKLFKGEPGEGVPILRYEMVDKRIARLREAERCIALILKEDTTDEAVAAYITFCEIIRDNINFFGIRDLNLSVSGACHSIYKDKVTGRVLMSIGYRTEQAVYAYECVKIYLVNILTFAGYHEGIRNLFKDEVKIERLMQENNNAPKVQRIISRLSSDTPFEPFD